MKNHRKNSSYMLSAKFRSAIPLSILLLGIILLSPACYEAREGCLDVNAVNYALDTDRECADCCEYPVLSLRFVSVWEDQDTSFTFRYASDGFHDGKGQPFLIDRITYYIQDVALVANAGALHYTSDSVEVQKLTDSGTYEEVYIRDDYLLLNPALNTALEVGTLLRNGTFTHLRFQVGLDVETDDILPGSLPTNHPLSLLDTSMYNLNDERYLSNRMDLMRDTAATASSLLLSYGTEQQPLEISLEIPGSFALPPGLDLEITLQVNYAKWFEQISDIRVDSEAELLDKIVAGLSNSFTFLEISADER
ncbi:MAG: hypothetical protein KDD15_10175 [Lewinella sp.]|nr:hypothetical protein [Lewinella sp.]